MGCTKSKNKQASIPWALNSHSRQDWIAWRSCFLSYMHDQNVPVYKQGSKLLEYIGNLGQEIAKNFYFHNFASETDINTLLQKFDIYFIFGCRKRHANETIKDYVKALEEIAEKTAKSNIKKVLNEKLLQDFKSNCIMEQFLKIVPSFSKVDDYESLALHELIFIWEVCENNKDNLHEEIINKNNNGMINWNNHCLYCGDIHEKNKCRAKGERCRMCGEFNHFARCCLKNFIKDCPKCGTAHVQHKCPAYSKECPRCKKINHFSWMCLADMILVCDFCGRSHVNNRQICPAKDSICANCRKFGHFSFKCRSRRNSRK